MFAEFIAEAGVLKGLVLSLQRGEEWIMGRDPDLCSIVIEDPKASRQHARIRKEEMSYIIENLSESNPLLLNDHPIVSPTRLQEGDVVTIGETLFRFYPNGAPGTVRYVMREYEDEIPLEGEEEAKRSEEQAPELPTEKVSGEARSIPHEEEAFASESFEPPEMPEFHVDLTPTTRFLIKVIAGPNTGAEFALDYDKSYLIGTDPSICDIIFNDLSVSREHARLTFSKEGIVTIQDLESRNGVVVDRERIIGTKSLTANSVVALGTSVFLLIDREAPSETIAAPLYEPAAEEEEEAPAVVEGVEKPREEVAAITRLRRVFPGGTFVMALIIAGLAVLFGIGLVSLFQTKEVTPVSKDYMAELQEILNKYPAVQYTFNRTTGKLFLLGHVKTGVELNELCYQLRGLGFIQGLENNIVNDEAVWQEMNILLSKRPDFKGVCMHSPEAGQFVVTGYLQTEQQASDLSDFFCLNFNYLNLLQNRVIVEEAVLKEVINRLTKQGFGAVVPTLLNGDLQLVGYIASHQVYVFDKTVGELKMIPGIRTIRNLVIPMRLDQEVPDLNNKYRAQRYKVTGFSKHGDININVVINGRILTRGDCIDGYTITGIQPQAIFLEKEGLKYKIEYNKCSSFGEESCASAR